MSVKSYDSQKAIAYAHQWAFSRNPAYYDFSGLGGDCSNFCSQCVYAGSRIMNYTPIHGWYYISAADRAPSWSGVKFLYNFLVHNQSIGPFAVETDISRVVPGDLIQLSFDGNQFVHSLLIVHIHNIPSPDNILIATHSFDSDNRQLSSYDYAEIRYLHILGVRSNEH